MRRPKVSRLNMEEHKLAWQKFYKHYVKLPTALTKLGKPKGLIDHRGLGEPQILGDDAESKFRLWSVKLEDYAHGVFGGKSREVMEWASAMDAEITENDIMDTFGINADDLDRWEDIGDFNSQLYSVLRATTESVAFDIVENVTTGQGLEAWRALHRRFDPATGSRKRIMLQALTNPERASYDSLQSALERWKALKSRYDKKRDQFGQREALPDSLAMDERFGEAGPEGVGDPPVAEPHTASQL